MKPRPLREWKAFRPYFDRHDELCRWGRSHRSMGWDERPEIQRVVAELAAKAGMPVPKLFVDEWRFISADSMELFLRRMKQFGLMQHLGEKELKTIASLEEYGTAKFVIDGAAYTVFRNNHLIEVFEKTPNDNAGAWRINKQRSGMAFTDGFLENCISDKEIRYVIGHELGHIKMKHFRLNPHIFGEYYLPIGKIERQLQILVPCVLTMISATGIGIIAGVGAFVAYRIMKNAINRMHERQAIRFSVKLNGDVKEAVLERTGRIDKNPAGVKFRNMAGMPLSRFLLDGQVYMALRSIFPEKLRDWNIVFSSEPEIGIFRRELEKRGLAGFLDDETAKKISAMRESDYFALKFGKTDYVVDIMDGRLLLRKKSLWNKAETWISEYMEIGYQNGGKTIKERILGTLFHFIFADHPSGAKELRVIEKAERKYRKEHPDWKPPEEVVRNAVKA